MQLTMFVYLCGTYTAVCTAAAGDSFKKPFETSFVKHWTLYQLSENKLRVSLRKLS